MRWHAMRDVCMWATKFNSTVPTTCVPMVLTRDSDGGITLSFNRHDAEFSAALQRAGRLALPPYIEREAGPTPEDSNDYQTIFATHEGAVAAPTAGLHFTPDLIAALNEHGIRCATITLHVGAGTFLPVRTDNISQHHMHAERGEVMPAPRTLSTQHGKAAGAWWRLAPPACG